MTTHIELGHALITMIEPDRETVVAYNDWYERDHFLSGVLAGPGAFAGRRFVATRELKSLRFPGQSPVARPVGDGSFITVYWIEKDQLDAHCAWGFPEAARLAELGRMNANRHHVSTSYYDVLGSWAAGDDSVPLELALHHPYPGLVAIWESGSSTGAPEQLLTADLPIDRVVTFSPIELPEPLPQMPGVIIGQEQPSDVSVHCCFLRTDPRSAWDAIATRIQDVMQPLLAAPFVPTVPGTRSYLEDLW